jgi:type IV secretory pathway VirB2 component (pilin)
MKDCPTKAKAITMDAAYRSNLHKALFVTMLSLAIYILFADLAFAQSDTAMGAVLCAVVDMIFGNLGRGLATLAVIIVGVGATLGKVSWGLAITVAVGIAVIFNADDIVDGLGAGAGGCP